MLQNVENSIPLPTIQYVIRWNTTSIVLRLIVDFKGNMKLKRDTYIS